MKHQERITFDIGFFISLLQRSDFERIDCRRITAKPHKRTKEHTRYCSTGFGALEQDLRELASKSWLRKDEEQPGIGE